MEELEKQAKDTLLNRIIVLAENADRGGMRNLAEAWSLLTGAVISDFDPDDGDDD